MKLSVCRQLHRDKTVTFAGYKIPHPLEYQMLVKVATTGKRSPIQVVGNSLRDLQEEVAMIRSKFSSEVKNLRR